MARNEIEKKYPETLKAARESTLSWALRRNLGKERDVKKASDATYMYIILTRNV